MPKKKPDRSHAYYLKRLEDKHPSVHGDYLAGKFTLAEALRVAGLRSRETPLLLLQRAWRRASSSEQDAFKHMIGCRPSTPGSAPAPPAALLPPSRVVAFQPDQTLHPDGAKKIQEIMDAHKLDRRAVMDLLGRSRLDASLWTAIARGTRVHDRDLREAVQRWLDSRP